MGLIYNYRRESVEIEKRTTTELIRRNTSPNKTSVELVWSSLAGIINK